MPTDRRAITALAAVHLAGWLAALAGVVLTIGPDRVSRVLSVLIRGEQWLLLALAAALIVVAAVAGAGIWAWHRTGAPWLLLAAVALSVPAAAAALGRWPQLVPWWAWICTILVEGCGLAAAYLALDRRRTS